VSDAFGACVKQAALMGATLTVGGLTVGTVAVVVAVGAGGCALACPTKSAAAEKEAPTATETTNAERRGMKVMPSATAPPANRRSAFSDMCPAQQQTGPAPAPPPAPDTLFP